MQRQQDTGKDGLGKKIPMAAVRLKECLEVMKRMYPNEVGDITVSMLMGCITDSPTPVFHQGTSASFGHTTIPFTKLVNDGEGTSKTVVLEQDEDYPKKSMKCIVFDIAILSSVNLDINATVVEENMYKTVLVSRKAQQVTLYDEFVSGTWKGYRVVPGDEHLFSDSEDDLEASQAENLSGSGCDDADVVDREIKRLKTHEYHCLDDASPESTQDHLDYGLDMGHPCGGGCGGIITNGSQMCSRCARTGGVMEYDGDTEE